MSQKMRKILLYPYLNYEIAQIKVFGAPQQQDIFCLFFCGAYHRYLGLINITRYKEIYGGPKIYGRRQTYMPVSHKVMGANSPDVLTPF